MARCLLRHDLSVVKFGQILKYRTNVWFPLSPRGSGSLPVVQAHFSRWSGVPTGRKCLESTWWAAGPRPLTAGHRSHFIVRQSELGTRRFDLANWTFVSPACCSSSTCGQRSLHGKARERFVQTRRKIRETGEKVKERMEDFAVRRENVLTIPNLLCGARIVLSPVLGYLVVQKSFECALGVFVFAGLTDLLDGFIARNFKNQQSTFGSFLDPLADKFLVFCLILSLTCSQLMPVPLTALIIARDVCLIGASAYVRYVSLPLPKTWSSYFDVTRATARLSPTLISKCNTFVQLMLVACTLASPVFHLEHHPFLPVLWYITATTTVASALSYVFSKNTYHILRDLKDKK